MGSIYCLPFGLLEGILKVKMHFQLFLFFGIYANIPNQYSRYINSAIPVSLKVLSLKIFYSSKLIT